MEAECAGAAGGGLLGGGGGGRACTAAPGPPLLWLLCVYLSKLLWWCWAWWWCEGAWWPWWWELGAEDASLLSRWWASDASCGSEVHAEDAEALGAVSNGTVPYSRRQPGHWFRQCSLICCTQNKQTRYLCVCTCSVHAGVCVRETRCCGCTS